MINSFICLSSFLSLLHRVISMAAVRLSLWPSLTSSSCWVSFHQCVCDCKFHMLTWIQTRCWEMQISKAMNSKICKSLSCQQIPLILHLLSEKQPFYMSETASNFTVCYIYFPITKALSSVCILHRGGCLLDWTNRQYKDKRLSSFNSTSLPCAPVCTCTGAFICVWVITPFIPSCCVCPHGK